MLTVGFDIGLTGAFAVLDQDERLVALHDLPVMTHGSAKWIDGDALYSTLCDVLGDRRARAVVERVAAMPKLGTVAANSKGMTLGSTLATLQIARIPIELVAPTTWKRALGLIAPEASDRDKKHASLCRARMLFPGASLAREKDHGRAEALLIAHWACRNKQGALLPEVA